MEINKKLLDKIAQSSPIDNTGEISFSLMVASKKNPGIKKLNLQHLTVEQRKEKLAKYAAENRFVAMIRKGDEVFAHAHKDFAEGLKNLAEFSFEGRKVTQIVGLSDKDYTEEMSLVLEAFESSLMEEPKKQEEESESDVLANSVSKSSNPHVKQTAANKAPSSMMTFLLEMAAKPGKIVLDCLRKVNEDRRAEEKQKEVDEKHFQIKQQEIQKGILKEEITKEQVAKQALTKKIVIDHAIRTGAY